MELKNRIKLKQYILLCIIITLVFTFFLSGLEEIGILILLMLGVITNQLILVSLVLMMTSIKKTISSSKILVLSIGKILSLIIPLVTSVHFMQDKLIIPLAYYIIMLINLGLCLKR